jgi:hypothetical protein
MHDRFSIPQLVRFSHDLRTVESALAIELNPPQGKEPLGRPRRR